MFKDSLTCIRKFVKSDGEIRVMWNVGDIACWKCGVLGLWDVRDVDCLGCGIFAVWDVRNVRCSEYVDVGCSGRGMFGMWEVWNLGCGMWDVCRDVGC